MRSSPPPPPPPYLLDETPSLTPDLLAVPSAIVTKKRRFSFTDNLSSDPLFSDDVSDAELLVDGHRRKRTVKCPWWELRARKMTVTIAQRPARADTSTFKAVDSGVWMGSDDTASEYTFQETPAETIPSAIDSSALASKAIQACLEDGNQVLDLSNLWLDDLPDSTLRPLHHLVPRLPTDHRRPPSEEEYRPLKPSIQLYLSSNRLVSLPLELLGLQISVLSLRNNLLTELPYNIDKLDGLQELNIAGNQLQHLPWGLFAVIRSAPRELITLRPNPFLSLTMLPQDEYDILADTFVQKMNQIRREHAHMPYSRTAPVLSICLASSVPCRFDADGSPRKRDLDSLWAPSLRPDQRHDEPESKVASLFEMALRKAQQNQLPNDVSQLLPPDSPMRLMAALARAAQNQYHGNDRCSTCLRDMLIPRAEWVEYWFHDRPHAALSDDSVIPFLRKACSAQCTKPTSLGTYWAKEDVRIPLYTM